jgi:hypothetical protein
MSWLSKLWTFYVHSQLKCLNKLISFAICECLLGATQKPMSGFSWNFILRILLKFIDTFHLAHYMTTYAFLLTEVAGLGNPTWWIHSQTSAHANTLGNRPSHRHHLARHPTHAKVTDHIQLWCHRHQSQRSKIMFWWSIKTPITTHTTYKSAFTNWKCRGNNRANVLEILCYVYIS